MTQWELSLWVISYLAYNLNLAFMPPEVFTVMVQLPFFFAVITPSLFTTAIFLELDEKLTVSVFTFGAM